MKAAVVHGTRDLRVDERPSPTPGPGDVLIAVEWGGICGSDLSYFSRGASGTAVLRHPLVLGHEVAGRVVDRGQDVPTALDGQRVAVMPASLPDGVELDDVWAHRSNLHPELRYLGSAAHDPHTDGGFRQLLSVPADQALPLPHSVDTRRGALAEPLAVALHAINRAREASGALFESADVVVNGCGPIGLLLIAALTRRGAGRVVAADISSSSLALASQMGADELIDLSQGLSTPEAPVVFEASGAPAALEGALAGTSRGGTLVQVGNLPKNPAPAVLGDLISREITWIGSFRFRDEMPDAIELLGDGLDVDPLMTHEFDLSEAHRAFETALDPAVASSKVMLRIQ
ncbi:zinc-binding dehydrogenase [Nesterenkonia xinjiangensis]|uniref:L-idonate 5-dehydrogenase n=1 Tax=Nesterenkonia xinjiangensis TaxID=225327 RepID=A0A7Z0GM04_9MICC|nr:L-idonate 5-dehydrogenase [Nesterenkonia xinjiangensis]